MVRIGDAVEGDESGVKAATVSLANGLDERAVPFSELFLSPAIKNSVSGRPGIVGVNYSSGKRHI